MQAPDYRRDTIVNLMSSVERGLGGAPGPYPALEALPPSALGEGHVVVLVVDGLGYELLEARARGGNLHSHLAVRLSSVFPTTTASAITTFLTATAPQQHGITGWFTYFRELGAVLAPLPFRARMGGPALGAEGVDPAHVFDTPSLFARVPVECHVVVPEHLLRSDYNRAHTAPARCHGYQGLWELFARVTRLLTTAGPRRYVYAYWPEVDSRAHTFGAASAEVALHLAEVDAAFGRFLSGLGRARVTVLVTADHGLIDTAPARRVQLGDHPALADTLALPLCGEERAAFCYLRHGRGDDFLEYVSRVLADRFSVVASAELVAAGMFGLGEPHPRLAERVGDYVLLGRENWCIKDWLPSERHFGLTGVHGGLSDSERYVPLVVVQR